MSIEPEPLIPISAIEHHVYCPRQSALIHVDGVWSDNAHTVRGSRGHRRVDSGAHKRERERLVLRGIPLWSERLGLTGRADAVEVHKDETLVPVEYKIGRRHGSAADLQLCAEALCLEEMIGSSVPVGFLWLASPRRRMIVRMDPDLRARTETVIEEIRAFFGSKTLPPAVDDARCPECQLLAHCMPGLVARADSTLLYLRKQVFGCGS